MLALASNNTTTLAGAFEPATGAVAFGRKGRANANANRATNKQRSSSNKKFSSRLRFVIRGSEGVRNINELNEIRSRELRRIK
jgi:hypothetical protein